MTTEPAAGARLSSQAQDVWAIVGHAVQGGEPGLLARTYQALQTWPRHGIPDDVWNDILTLLPLEDQTRLAQTSHDVQAVMERLVPQALNPNTHQTPDFVRTLYTQTELDTSLDENPELAFIPGTDSDLTIGNRRACVQLYGPGTLSAITGGTVRAVGDVLITMVTGRYLYASDQATVTTVNGGFVYASDQATVTTVNGGEVYASDQATVTTVNGGEVCASGEATVTTVTGGAVSASGEATVTTVTGGHVYASGQATVTEAAGGDITVTENATITAVSGDAHITAHGNAHITIPAGADAVHVDAHDTANITAHSGTITIHSPGVTATNHGNAHITPNNGNGDTALSHEQAGNPGDGCTLS
ncbi:hypothetical protein [Streptomyces sp. NPDC057910]|uniref:hypothetical protein n=1 Tax=Streptomyces sp. NPDC057910 TaxID=3346278 RepID=UPI0036EE42D5